MALAAASLLLSGCNTASQMASMGMPSNSARSPVLDTKPQWRIAVLPPTSSSSSFGAATANLADYAGLALLRTDRFTLVDRSVVEELLDEQEFSYSGAVDPSTAVRLGSMLGAEAVMTINVSSISHDGFWEDEPDQRDASIMVKIISVETAEVLYTSTGEGSSFDGAEDALRMAMEVSLIGLFDGNGRS